MSRIAEKSKIPNSISKHLKENAEAISLAFREPLLVLNKDLVVLASNEAFYSCFNTNEEHTFNHSIYELQDNSWDIPELHNLFGLLPEKRKLHDFKFQHKLGNRGTRHFLVNATRQRQGNEEVLILLSFQEDTKEKHDKAKEKDYLKPFLDILAQAPAMICILRGPDHVFEVANEKYLQLVANRDIMGKPVREALPEAEYQGFPQILDQVYNTGEPFIGNELPFQLHIANDVKKETFINFVYQPTRDTNGAIDGIFVHAIDVSEQVQARKKIENSEYRYKQMIHSSPYSIATFTGRDHIIEIANDSILEAWGKGDKVIGQPLLEAVPELIDQGFDKILNHVWETEEPYEAHEMPIHLLRKGKMELTYFSFFFYPQRDANGEMVGIIDLATEVTPQAIFNKQIKESETHFRQMADLMPDKVINTDAKGNLIYLNKNWLEFTGSSAEELKSKGLLPYIHESDKEEYSNRWKNSLKSGTGIEIEVRFLDKNGKYHWHLKRAEPVWDENGEIKLWIGTCTGIQKLKEEEERKEAFLKMVSHELKTPVTSIKGYAQLLLGMLNKSKGATPTAFEPSLKRIDYQVTRLTRLIAEMLDLTRLEENKLQLQKEKFDLNKLIDETVQDISYTNTTHNITLSHDFHCEVYGDRDRIGQVLINLLTNAIKYSPENQEIQLKVQKASKNKVMISIKDQGIGIAEENHKKIFSRFVRVGGKNEETYSGFGIGLFLAREIIERHGSKIEVQSEKGKGSTFSFTLAID